LRTRKLTKATTSPIMGSQKSATAVAMGVPIVALGLPLFDTSLAVTRHLLRGKHPFQADRDHLHHRLLALGFSQPQVAIILYAVSVFLAVMGLLMVNARGAVAALIVLCLVLAVIAAMNRLKAGELRELRSLLRYGERRRPSWSGARRSRRSGASWRMCGRVSSLRRCKSGAGRESCRGA